MQERGVSRSGLRCRRRIDVAAVDGERRMAHQISSTAQAAWHDANGDAHLPTRKDRGSSLHLRRDRQVLPRPGVAQASDRVDCGKSAGCVEEDGDGCAATASPVRDAAQLFQARIRSAATDPACGGRDLEHAASQPRPHRWWPRAGSPCPAPAGRRTRRVRRPASPHASRRSRRSL